MKLENTVAIVTGGASGLGLGAVQDLAAQKCKIVIADINEEQGQAVAKTLPDAIFVKTDISNEESVQNLISAAVKKYGAIHVVVNCAGVISAGLTVTSKGVIETKEFWRVFNINVIGTFNVCKYAAQQMLKQEVATSF
jgi:NAD(P)-dependent dehydrogenase (short-subunit alcohol dehydrogenase family)